MIEVKCVELQDLEVLVPLFEGYRSFYKQELNSIEVYEFLYERIANNESRIFLAFKDQAAVGFVQLYPLFSSVSMQRLWLLNDLFVSNEFRKRGVAKQLMLEAVQMVEEEGAKGLMLETGIDNIPAQKLYESLGWVKTEDYYMYTKTIAC